DNSASAEHSRRLLTPTASRASCAASGLASGGYIPTRSAMSASRRSPTSTASRSGSTKRRSPSSVSSSPKPSATVPDHPPFSGNGRRFRLVAVVPFDEEDESPFVGLLQVEAE